MTQTKVNLLPNERSKSQSIKRAFTEPGDDQSTKKTKGSGDGEEDVDYGEIDAESPPSQQAVDANSPENEPAPDKDAVADIERSRIHAALESWCRSNVSVEEGDAEGDDRVAALAEVGMLLVFEQEKYPDAEAMRAELEDIGSIIGGDQVVKKYINFLLSLQNQLKKSKAMADRQHRQHQFSRPGHQQMMYPMHPMPFPMMMHPPNPNMFGHPQMYPQPPFGMMGPHPPGPRGNMTLNATGEMSAVQKQKEKERKRKEILHECTEHLKALLERVSKASSPEEKAKIFELIDKVKKRIDSLRETHPSAPAASAGSKPAPSAGKAGIRGYYSNQYVNPSLAPTGDATHEEGSQ